MYENHDDWRTDCGFCDGLFYLAWRVLMKTLIRAINHNGTQMFWTGQAWSPDHKSGHDYQCKQIAEDLLTKVQPFKDLPKVGITCAVVEVR